MALQRRTKFLLAGVAASLAGGAAVWFAWGDAPTEAPSFEAVSVARVDLAETVTASGTVSPLVTVQVGSQVSGRIQSLGVDFNSEVTRGQVIATIDPRLFQSEVAKMRASLLVAKAAVTRTEAELAEARRKLARLEQLAKDGFANAAEVETARAGADALAAQLESAKASGIQVRASLEQAEANLAYTTIVSPIDGVVISRSVDVGQTVTASLQAPTLFTIAEDLKKMEVHTNVAESDVGRIKKGMAVDFTVDAFPAAKFAGQVKEVRYAPQTVQNVVTYDAVVAVENPDGKLRPGMTADVTFLVEARKGVLAVPNGALRFQPADDVLAKFKDALSKGAPKGKPGRGPSRQRVVWVIGAAGALAPKSIEAGISDGTHTEVVSGDLREGESLAVGVAAAGDGAAPKRSFGRFL